MGESSVTYRPDLGQVIDRQSEWYEGKRKYLITIIPNRWNGYNWDLSIDIQTAKSLEEYDFRRDDQLFDFLDFRVKQYEYYWNLHGEWNLNDDFIPVFEPRLGWAEVVAPFVRDAVVQYYAQTSQIEPFVLDYDGFDWSRISFQPDHPGAQLLEKMNAWCCERGRGRFLIQPRGLDTNPSDTAKALRGNRLFTDFIEHPAELHHLLEIATQCSIESIEYQRKVIDGPTLGGYGTTWHGGYWTPGNVIGHLGDNVSDLISGKMFEQFLLPYLQKFTDHFGGCVFARDITSKQVWRYLRKFGNILAFKPRSMGSTYVMAEDLYTIVKNTEGLPLFLQVFSYKELEEFRRVVAETGIRAFFVFQCPTREEGERALDTVRSME